MDTMRKKLESVSASKQLIVAVPILGAFAIRWTSPWPGCSSGAMASPSALRMRTPAGSASPS